MAGAPVAAALPGPDTVADTGLESFRPSAAQIALAAAQSVVAARVSVMSSYEDGRTRTATRRFSPRVTRFVSTSRPPVTSSSPAANADSRTPSNSSLNTISKPNSFFPWCAAGRSSEARRQRRRLVVVLDGPGRLRIVQRGVQTGSTASG